MEPAIDSLYITVSSGKFSGNAYQNSSNFETQLFKPVTLQKELYEVGLVQIIYKPMQDIFNGRQHVHVFNTGEHKAAFHMKVESTITHTISRFNVAVSSTSVEIITHYQKDKSVLKLKVPYKVNEIVRFEEDTRRLLGYEKLEYPVEENNTIIAENEYNDEELKRLQGTVVIFYVVRNPNLNKTIEIKQPYDVKSINDFVTEINVALMNEKIDVEFHAEAPKITFESKDPKLNLQFSNEINRILGVDKNHIITGEEAEFDSVDLYRGNKLILLESDLVEHQIWGTTCKPIIKVLPQSHESIPLVNTFFHPIQYMGLGKSDIKSINLRASNESDEELILDKHQGITCVFHLRLRFNV